MWALAGKRKTAYNTHCSWQGQKGCGMRPSTRKCTQQLDGFQVVREDLIVERCAVEDLSRLARLSCHRRRMSSPRRSARSRGRSSAADGRPPRRPPRSTSTDPGRECPRRESRPPQAAPQGPPGRSPSRRDSEQRRSAHPPAAPRQLGLKPFFSLLPDCELKERCIILKQRTSFNIPSA